MSMRRAVLVSFWALILLVPSRGLSQPLQSFEDLALRVDLDDRLQIEDLSGRTVAGRLVGLTRDEIAIQTDAGERRFSSDTVRGVALRGHSLRSGALIGVGLFAVLGAVATCAHEGGANCVAIGALRAAPVGAGAGLAGGALVSRMRTVYRKPEGRGTVPGTRAGGGPSLLEDLALRVDLDDDLRVEDSSGGRITGRLIRLTAGEITIRTASGEKRFQREDVRQVAVRRQPLRMAVLIGAGAGADTGAAAACTGPERDECADAPILVGAVGAGLGFLAGTLIHRTTIVYPETEKRAAVVVSPAISGGAAGLSVGLSW
jgi:hypothetical protein